MRHIRARHAYDYASCGVKTEQIVDTWDEVECPRCREIHLAFYSEPIPDVEKLPGAQVVYVVLTGDWETTRIEGVYLDPEAAERRRERQHFRQALHSRELSDKPLPAIEDVPGLWSEVKPWAVRGKK